MATLQEQITALQEAISTGTKSVTIGDRSIVYRDLDEMLKALSLLKAQLSASSATSPPPFSITYINNTKGL